MYMFETGYIFYTIVTCKIHVCAIFETACNGKEVDKHGAGTSLVGVFLQV